MTTPEMIKLLKIEVDTPPWDGDSREVQATVMANRRPVRVRVLAVCEYWGRQMVTVQALRGRPFPHTNTWYHTGYSDMRKMQMTFLRDVTLVY